MSLFIVIEIYISNRISIELHIFVKVLFRSQTQYTEMGSFGISFNATTNLDIKT